MDSKVGSEKRDREKRKKQTPAGACLLLLALHVDGGRLSPALASAVSLEERLT